MRQKGYWTKIPTGMLALATRVPLWVALSLTVPLVLGEAFVDQTATAQQTPPPGPQPSASQLATPVDKEHALQQTGLVDLAELKGKIRVAILPFVTPKDQPELEQYGPGTMDSLITALKTIPAFIMLDRGRIDQIITAQAFGQTGLVDPKTATRIGKLLQAQTLITGSIQTASKEHPQQLLIIANFVDVKTGKLRQTQQVSGMLQEIFDLQEQLAGLFIKSQNTLATTDQLLRVDKVLKSTGNLVAYDHYLQGRKAFYLFSPEGWAEAINWYGKAIEVDPKYALAHAGLAETWSYWGFHKMKNGQAFQVDFQKAYTAGQTALELNPELAEAHRAFAKAIMITSPGFMTQNLDEKTFRAVEKEMRQALELNPNDADTWYDFWFLSGNGNDPDHEYVRKALALNPDLSAARNDRAAALFARQRNDEALAELREVVRISPGSALAHSNLGRALNRLQRYEDAVAELREAVRLDPRYAAAHVGLGGTLMQLKRYEEAIPRFQAALEINVNLVDAHFLLGHAYHQLERWDGAVHEYKETLRLNPTHPQATRMLPEAQARQKAAP